MTAGNVPAIGPGSFITAAPSGTFTFSLTAQAVQYGLFGIIATCPNTKIEVKCTYPSAKDWTVATVSIRNINECSFLLGFTFSWQFN